MIERAQAVRAALDGFPRHYPRFVLEQAAIAGALNTEILSDKGKAQEAAAYIARRLDQLSDETERGWRGEPMADGGLKFRREVRGVTETIAIDGALIASADARKLDRMANELQAGYLRVGLLKRKDAVVEVRAPSQLLDAIFQWGRSGLSLQRYKGLGEMNPDQLRATTLTPGNERLVRVSIEDAHQAMQHVNLLMGNSSRDRKTWIMEAWEQEA
jgi:DNA gyrase subunit B